MNHIKEELFADLDPESTVMGLKDHIGEQYSIRDLLYAMLLPSGADASLALASLVGGREEGMVELMNKKDDTSEPLDEELGKTGRGDLFNLANNVKVV